MYLDRLFRFIKLRTGFIKLCTYLIKSHTVERKRRTVVIKRSTHDLKQSKTVDSETKTLNNFYKISPFLAKTTDRWYKTFFIFTKSPHSDGGRSRAPQKPLSPHHHFRQLLDFATSTPSRHPHVPVHQPLKGIYNVFSAIFSSHWKKKGHILW